MSCTLPWPWAPLSVFFFLGVPSCNSPRSVGGVMVRPPVQHSPSHLHNVCGGSRALQHYGAPGPQGPGTHYLGRRALRGRARISTGSNCSSVCECECVSLRVCVCVFACACLLNSARHTMLPGITSSLPPFCLPTCWRAKWALWVSVTMVAVISERPPCPISS